MSGCTYLPDPTADDDDECVIDAHMKPWCIKESNSSYGRNGCENIRPTAIPSAASAVTMMAQTSNSP